jgi:dihydroorotase
MNKLLLIGGRLIDPETKMDKVADLLIEDGIIKVINPVNPPLDVDAVNVRGKIIIPGVIDMHVHLRDFEQAYKETVETGTKAALKGGVTTVFAMPNTKPPLDNARVIKEYKHIIENEAHVNTYICGAITIGIKGQELSDFESYKKLGLKFVTDDGCDVNDDGLLRKAYESAKKNGLTVMTHPEMNSISPSGVINEGSVSKKLNIPGQPNEKEWKAVERGIKAALSTGAKAHFTHLSTKESVELIRKAKKKTDLITCDTTPHHFSLTEDEVLKKGSTAKVNPPLRKEEDRMALIEGIKDGTIDAIVTDHAPHSAEEKNTDLTNASFGFSGLEILVPAAITELYFNQKIDLARVISLMTLNPAKIAGLESGRIQLDAPADLTIIDLNTEKAVNSKEFVSKGQNTPFDGMKLKGWPVMTVYNGIANEVTK